VESVLTDPETSAELGARLEHVQQVVEFAADLGLSVDGQYTSYVEWPGNRVVTTLVATLPRSISASEFWFPLIGNAPYKGFFDPERAAREAERLAGQGYDTCLLPVLAYSTLGWFDDPLTGPMVRQSEARLTETVLHELVHATVFVASQPDFNEGLATFIGQEAAVRFAGTERSREDDPGLERTRITEDRQIAAVLERFRARVSELYERIPAASDPDPTPERALLEVATRAELGALPLTTRDASRLAEGIRLNDACQALAATYQADLGRWAAALDAYGGDLPALVERVRQAADEEDPRATLLGLESGAP
jgi:predicted aminopeptidase